MPLRGDEFRDAELVEEHGDPVMNGRRLVDDPLSLVDFEGATAAGLVPTRRVDELAQPADQQLGVASEIADIVACRLQLRAMIVGSRDDHLAINDHIVQVMLGQDVAEHFTVGGVLFAHRDRIFQANAGLQQRRLDRTKTAPSSSSSANRQSPPA